MRRSQAALASLVTLSFFRPALLRPACTPLTRMRARGGAERGLVDLVARRKITGIADESSLLVLPLLHSDAVICLRCYSIIIDNL